MKKKKKKKERKWHRERITQWWEGWVLAFILKENWLSKGPIIFSSCHYNVLAPQPDINSWCSCCNPPLQSYATDLVPRHIKPAPILFPVSTKGN